MKKKKKPLWQMLWPNYEKAYREELERRKKRKFKYIEEKIILTAKTSDELRELTIKYCFNWWSIRNWQYQENWLYKQLAARTHEIIEEPLI